MENKVEVPQEGNPNTQKIKILVLQKNTTIASSTMAKGTDQTKPAEPAPQNSGSPPQGVERNPPWTAMRSLKSCREVQTAQPQPRTETQAKPQTRPQTREIEEMQEALETPRTPKKENNNRCVEVTCSARSFCRDKKGRHRHGNSPSPEHEKKENLTGLSRNFGGLSASRSMKAPQHKSSNAATLPSSSSSNSSNFYSSLFASTGSSSTGKTGSFRVKSFSRFSNCYEGKTVVEQVHGTTEDSSPAPTDLSCPQCAESFMEAENLELHQAFRHAVSELDPEEPSKNIVEIIFQSSWHKKDAPICNIDRILKVHNSPKTISKFEQYRELIKSRAAAANYPKKYPRCAADGNELLRFHCATSVCSIGVNGSSSLCNSIPHCSVCSIIRDGFRIAGGEVARRGILTTATSGRAHDESDSAASEDEQKAMLVCRVIAGRVKKKGGGTETEGTSGEEGEEKEGEFDSVGGRGASCGAYSNLDELYVFNPTAILPCFVVVYRGF